MANFLAWSNANMVTQEIEKQHQQLVELINRLCAGIANSKKTESLAVILDELLDYIHVHLAFEECYLHRINCWGHKIHTSIHDEIIIRVLTFQTQARADNYGLAMELLHFLQDWLVEHVSKWTDSKLFSPKVVH